MAAGNKNLNSAKTARKDEFYTQLTDIEKEMRYYRKHFKDKTGDGGVDMLDVAELFKSRENELTELKGDGDFRFPECLELLDEADIVVTNPPFSLFREYVAVLVEHKKKYLIIGNVNAVKYKEIFPLFMKNELWLGANIHSGDRAFFVPDNYPLDASGCGIDEETGRKFIRVKGVRWFTYMDIKQRHEELILVKRYNPDDYPMVFR